MGCLAAGITPLLVILVATAGNFLGSALMYLLARAGRRIARGKHAPFAERLFARYGGAALLASWLPLVGDLIVVAAGVFRYPFTLFALWTASGKALRYLAVWLAFAGWK